MHIKTLMIASFEAIALIACSLVWTETQDPAKRGKTT